MTAFKDVLDPNASQPSLLLTRQNRQWWKDADVYEDKKFACVLHDNSSMRKLTDWRLLTDHKLHLLFGG